MGRALDRPSLGFAQCYWGGRAMQCRVRHLAALSPITRARAGGNRTIQARMTPRRMRGGRDAGSILRDAKLSPHSVRLDLPPFGAPTRSARLVRQRADLSEMGRPPEEEPCNFVAGSSSHQDCTFAFGSPTALARTGQPEPRPRPRTSRTDRRGLRRWCRLKRNKRPSTCFLSNGKARRFGPGPKPVPKSAIAMRTPTALSWRSVVECAVGVADERRSVISSSTAGRQSRSAVQKKKKIPFPFGTDAGD